MSLSFDDARRQLRLMTQAIRDAEADYRRAVEDAADAEAIYRRQLGERFRALRQVGEAVGSADIVAREQTVVQSRERDATAGRVKLAQEVLENRRGDRYALLGLMRWAAQRERPRDERTPGEEWP
jgi:hypothetical protein